MKYLEGGGPDPRCYRVSCDKLATALGFKTEWTVRRGAEEMHEMFKRHSPDRGTVLAVRATENHSGSSAR